MTENTKITLSNKEQELVSNTDWIITKHQIIKKVYDVFGALLLALQEIVLTKKNVLPSAIFIHSAKIFKGENYKQLPYVLLDYPRYFDKENIVAIRILFWWGNFFSINLQLSGTHKANAIPALLKNYLLLCEADYCICINNDPWQHHFEQDNYVPLKKYTEAEFSSILYSKEFIKVAKNITVHRWDDVPHFLEKSFKELIQLIEKQ